MGISPYERAKLIHVWGGSGWTLWRFRKKKGVLQHIEPVGVSLKERKCPCRMMCPNYALFRSFRSRFWSRTSGILGFICRQALFGWA